MSDLGYFAIGMILGVLACSVYWIKFVISDLLEIIQEYKSENLKLKSRLRCSETRRKSKIVREIIKTQNAAITKAEGGE